MKDNLLKYGLFSQKKHMLTTILTTNLYTMEMLWISYSKSQEQQIKLFSMPVKSVLWFKQSKDYKIIYKDKILFLWDTQNNRECLYLYIEISLICWSRKDHLRAQLKKQRLPCKTYSSILIKFISYFPVNGAILLLVQQESILEEDRSSYLDLIFLCVL